MKRTKVPCLPMSSANFASPAAFWQAPSSLASTSAGVPFGTMTPRVTA